MKNIRIPVDLNNDRKITFTLDQDFEQLEILSLKMSTYDIYAQMTSDFGVVVGRVSVNGGFGVQNAKVSLFIPITAEDELNNEISQLYPFKSALDKLPNGVRYNLFPRTKQVNWSHQPIGIFPDVTDLTHYPTYLEVYEKYYKFTTTSNDAGDYMLFGVPLGAQYMHMDFDLFDTKSFYLTADDLVTEISTSTSISEQLSTTLNQALNPDFELTDDGTYRVKIKSDLDGMPNIFSENKFVNVVPFWGDDTLHEIGITRCDFELNYEYVPTAIMFGSFLAMSAWSSIQPNYSIQTSSAKVGYGILDQDEARDLKIIVYKHLGEYDVERYGVYSGVPIPNSTTGVFIVNLPMYEDYFITNEYGQRVPSTSKRGIPTKGHYVFEFFDDDDGIYGNGRRAVEGNDLGWLEELQNSPIKLLNQSANLSAGIRVPADTRGHMYLGGWKTNDYGSATLFEYDIESGAPKFYTVQTEFKPHKGSVVGGKFVDTDVRYNGNIISYIPQINTAYDYNIPIDGTNAPDQPILIGTLCSPRFTVNNDRDRNHITLKVLNYANEMTWIPWFDKKDTANYSTRSWDWIFGVGVRYADGVNRGEVFNKVIEELKGVSKDFPEVITWFFGDNPRDGENVPIANYYAQLLAQKPDAINRNINGIHYRFNLATTPKYTTGMFVSSVVSGTSKVLFETSIVNVTDILPDLIKDSVYTSYGQPENKYKGDYYIFGRNANTKNALNIIKERYFNG